ncbi:MAG: hypothetical protein GY780_03015 [bacterium]|nr:hypothetical protein [bacterium]
MKNSNLSIWPLVVILLFFVGCASDDSSSPDTTLEVGDTVNLTMDLTLEVVEAPRAQIDPVKSSLQVTIESRLLTIADDFLEFELIPNDLTGFSVDGFDGILDIYENPEYPSRLVLSKRDSENNPISSTFGTLTMTIQIGESSRMMLGPDTELVPDQSDGDQLIPALGDIPTINLFFNDKTYNATASNLVIFISPTIIRGLENE